MIHWWDIARLGAAFRRRELTAVEATGLILARIERLAHLNAYALVTPELALSQAAMADDELARGIDRGPLHGVPIGIKDLCWTKGIPTGSGTTIWQDWRPDQDATIVERLRAAGAVMLGKLRMTEGAYGDHHPSLPAPLNPWDAALWTGASSTGSGVAVAAGLAFAAIGTDTGGSIRFPCACHGISGLKPGYGRVSRHGVTPLAPSMDHVGPMARSVADLSAMLAVLSGPDPADPATLMSGPSGPVRPVAGLRIGLDRAFNAAAEPEVVAALEEAAAVLAGLGAVLEEVRVPDTDAVTAGWTPLCAVEAAQAHAATYPARAAEYGPMLARLLALGHATGPDELSAIVAARAVFTARLRQLLTTVDLLLVPTLAWARPSLARLEGIADPQEVALLLRFTAPFDMSGSPALTLPCAAGLAGPAITCQLIGRDGGDEQLLAVGQAFQAASSWRGRHPPL